MLTSMRRLVILDSSVSRIKAEILPCQIARVDANHAGFSVSVNHVGHRGGVHS